MERKVVKSCLSILFISVVLSFPAYAALEISVNTDEDVYQLGEDITIYVTAYNPTSEEISLTFPSAKQVTYLMDEIFDYSSIKQYAPTFSRVQIAAYDFHVWTLEHTGTAATTYPLNLGTHSVIGEVVGYGESSPVSFEVVPEPITLSFLSLGFLFMRLRK